MQFRVRLELSLFLERKDVEWFLLYARLAHSVGDSSTKLCHCRCLWRHVEEQRRKFSTRLGMARYLPLRRLPRAAL